MIQSEIPIPEYLPATEATQPDILISRENYSLSQQHYTQTIFAEKLPNNTLLLGWKGVGTYRIEQGKKITIFPEENTHPALERQPLYGGAIAAILLQKNLLVLHASAVAINGRALIIAGDRGYGKSTLVASLLSKGHELISDDVTAFRIEPNSNIHVIPGLPNIKLWPDSANIIDIVPDNTPPLNPKTNKRLFNAIKYFHHKTTPLGSIIMLDRGPNLLLKKIPMHEKLLWLSYSNYFAPFHHALSKENHENILRKNKEVAQHPELFRLIQPDDIGQIPVTCRLLEQTCQ